MVRIQVPIHNVTFSEQRCAGAAPPSLRPAMEKRGDFLGIEHGGTIWIKHGETMTKETSVHSERPRDKMD